MIPRLSGWLAMAMLSPAMLFSAQPGPSPSPTPPPAPSAFQFAWAGKPSAPTRWVPESVDDWDVLVHDRDVIAGKAFPTATAQHGPNCAAAPATHLVNTQDDSVFICNNHMMTVSNSPGYGEIELTPARLADWSGGVTRITFRVSTFRTSNRDWLDINVSPFMENVIAPANSTVDLNGLPVDDLHCEMTPAPTRWSCFVVTNSQRTSLPSGGKSVEEALATSGQSASAITRTLFELDISRTHVRMGMPEYGNWFVDADASLSFAQGVVQLGHHTYSPDKECTPTSGMLSCTGNTWHWSDFAISSAVPFTMLRLPVGFDIVSHDAREFRLPAPVPADSFLRFSGVGTIQFSVNGGATWISTVEQPSTRQQSPWRNYWTRIPAGARTVTFRGTDLDCCWWIVQDPTVWSLTPVPAGSIAPVTGPIGVAAQPSVVAKPDTAQTSSVVSDPPLEVAWHQARRTSQMLLLPLVLIAVLLSFLQLLRARRLRRPRR